MGEFIQALIALRQAANKLVSEDQEAIDEIKLSPGLYYELSYALGEKCVVFGAHGQLKRLEFMGIDIKEGRPVFSRRAYLAQ